MLKPARWRGRGCALDRFHRQRGGQASLLLRLEGRCESLRLRVAKSAKHNGFLSWRAKLDELAARKILGYMAKVRHLVQEQATHD